MSFCRCLLVCALPQIYSEVDLITEPRPGEEYVLVSSGGQQSLKNFETSHKIPEKHPQHRVLKQHAEESAITRKHQNNKVHSKLSTEGIVSIEVDKRTLNKKGSKSKLPESIEIDVPVSKLEDIKIVENNRDIEINPKMAVALEAMSESGKLLGSSGTTTQNPILTTAIPTTTHEYDYIPVNFDSIDDINSGLLSSNVKLESAGTEQKQHSRIQIKKGPNGLDYEYEYIYYYYDDETENAKGKDKAPSKNGSTIHNSHDGPQKAETATKTIVESKNRNKYSSIDRSGTTTTSSTTQSSETQNEVLPSSRGRQRGRNISPAPVQEDIVEERYIHCYIHTYIGS